MKTVVIAVVSAILGALLCLAPYNTYTKHRAEIDGLKAKVAQQEQVLRDVVSFLNKAVAKGQ